jgi:hypothetical protein
VPKDTFNNLVRSGVERLFSGSSFAQISPKTGEAFFNGASLQRSLNSFGRETLDAALGKDGTESLMQFSRVASRINTSPPTVGMWGMGQLMGASASLASGDMGMAGAIMLTPAVLMKLATSKVGRRILTEGYSVRPLTAAATNLSGRLASFLNEDKGRIPLPFVKEE